jgi:hypothetical protein
MAVKDIDIDGNRVIITLAASPTGENSSDAYGRYIKWGSKNTMPNILLDLYKSHAEHGSIVKGKADYIAGTSIIPSVQDADVLNFVSKFTRNGINERKSFDQSLYGGFCILIKPNLLGTPLNYHHLHFGKLRFSDCETGVWYSEDWSNLTLNPKVFYPFFTKGILSESVFVYKNNTASVSRYDGIYPFADYQSTFMDLETDVETSVFCNSLVKNGFSVGNIITFYSGDIGEEKKRILRNKVESDTTGALNAGKVIIEFISPDGKKAEVTNISPNGLADQYESINKRLLQKILTGHNVNGILFGVQSQGSLGDRTILDLSHELQVSRSAPKQQPFLEFLKEQCYLVTGKVVEFSIEQLKLLSQDWTNPNITKYMTNAEVRDKLGLPSLDQDTNYAANKVKDALNSMSPLVANKVLEFMTEDEVRQLAALPSKTQQLSESQKSSSNYNEAMATLSMKQRADIVNLFNKFKNGKLSLDQAKIFLQAYGLSEVDVHKFLGIFEQKENNPIENQIIVQQSKMQSLVQLCTVEVSDDDEVIDVQEYRLSFKDDFIKSSPEKKSKSFLETIVDTFRGKEKEQDYEYEIYTVLKYALKPSLAAKGEPILLDTSHDFCKKMVAATSGNKRLTLAFVEKLENDFGDNAYDVRGGWTGKKPTCRHIWELETRRRKILK